MMSTGKFNADLLNKHLELGGHIRFLTHYKATEFRPRNAGCFFTAPDGSTWYGTGLKRKSRYVVADKDGKPWVRIQFASPK